MEGATAQRVHFCPRSVSTYFDRITRPGNGNCKRGSCGSWGFPDRIVQSDDTLLVAPIIDLTRAAELARYFFPRDLALCDPVLVTL